MVRAEEARDVEDTAEPDPLAALILDLNARLEALETKHKVAAQLIHTLADANGYEKWKKKSKLVTL